MTDTKPEIPHNQDNITAGEVVERLAFHNIDQYLQKDDRESEHGSQTDLDKAVNNLYTINEISKLNGVRTAIIKKNEEMANAPIRIASSRGNSITRRILPIPGYDIYIGALGAVKQEYENNEIHIGGYPRYAINESHRLTENDLRAWENSPDRQIVKQLAYMNKIDIANAYKKAITHKVPSDYMEI